MFFTEGESRRRRYAISRNEDTVGCIDPDFLDFWIIHIWLQGAQTGNLSEHLLRQDLVVHATARDHSSAEPSGDVGINEVFQALRRVARGPDGFPNARG